MMHTNFKTLQMRILLLLLFSCHCLNAQTIDKRISDFKLSISLIENNRSSKQALTALNYYFDNLPYEKALKYFETVDPSFSETESYKELENKVKNRRLCKPGNMIQSFQVMLPDSSYILLDSILNKSNLIILDFWGSWCLSCRENVPQLKEIYSNYKSRGLAIVSISVHEDAMLLWRNAIKKDGIETWTHVLDYDKSIQSALGIPQVPTFLLVSNGNVIIERYNGRYLGLLEMEKKIAEYLK
jgi:thiol-disulfide isomerase/thioredoxin